MYAFDLNDSDVEYKEMKIEEGFLQGLFKNVEKNGLKVGYFRICKNYLTVFEGVGDFKGDCFGRFIFPDGTFSHGFYMNGLLDGWGSYHRQSSGILKVGYFK